jgi:hypothetical protein
MLYMLSLHYRFEGLSLGAKEANPNPIPRVAILNDWYW